MMLEILIPYQVIWGAGGFCVGTILWVGGFFALTAYLNKKTDNDKTTKS